MPVSISGTTGYAGPLGSLTVGTTAIEANAVTPAKMSRSGTSGQVLTSNGAGADPSYQSLPAGGVTSAVAGNGIAVSASTGAVTFSAAAPTFNSIGSYVFGTLGTSAATAGTTYSAGGSNGQVRTAAIFYDCSGVMQINAQNTLSGTWRAMGGNVASPFGTMSLFCRTA